MDSVLEGNIELRAEEGGKNNEAKTRELKLEF